MKTTFTSTIGKLAIPKKLGWQLTGIAAGLLAAVPAFADYSYSKVPVFWSSGTQPNVMLVLDDSGSMGDPPSGGGANKIDTMKVVAKQVVTDNASKMRIGLFHFHDDGGKYSLPCGSSASSLNTAIDGLSADYWTPLASSLYETGNYFRGITPYSTSKNGSSAYASPIQYRCQKNFTVLLTDGKPTRGMEYPGRTSSDDELANGTLPPNGTKGVPPTDTAIGGITNPWGSSNTLASSSGSWDGFPDPKMSGDSDGYFPFLDDIAQFLYDIDMKTSTTAASGTCPSGSVGQSTGRDCAGKSWQDDDAGSTGEYAKQNMTTYTIGFDVQNELLTDAPLVNRVAFSASQIDAATNLITISGHGLKNGDYAQYYSTGAYSGSVKGMGQVDPTNTITSPDAAYLAAGTALTYSNAGGTSLQHSVFSSRTDTMTLTSAPAVGNIFTAPLSQITNLTNGTPVTAAATDNFHYEGSTITSAAFNNSKSNTTNNYFLLGYPAFQIRVGQPMTYNESGSGSSFPLVNGTTYYVQSCAGSVGTGTGTNPLAVNAVGTPCPPQAVNNIVKFAASAGGVVQTLPFTGTSSNNQSFTFKPTLPGKGLTFYVSGLNTTTGQFCLSRTSGGACANIVVPGSGTQSWTWNWTHTVNNPTTASTYYAIPVDATHFKLALTAANATASTPVPVKIFDGGNINQTFSYTLSGSVGGLYGYVTDLEPDSSPNPATEDTAKGKYCVVVDTVDPLNKFKLAKAYPGGSNTCPQPTPTTDLVDITNPGNGGILSTGPGESYYSTDAASLSKALNAAFNSINEKNLSFGGTSANGTTLSAGSRIYQAIFNTKTWSSTIVSKAFVNGVLSSTSSWGTMDTLLTLPRTILTYKPSTSAGVVLSYAGVDASQQQALTGSATANATTGGNVVSWLQGTDITGFRARTNAQKVGDIIDSGMIYVGASDFKLNAITTGGSTYDAYVTAKSGWESAGNAMIYAGANDGMVHGFQASDGKEKLTFIPNGVYRDWTDSNNDGVVNGTEAVDWKLFKLSQPDYEHRYFVNGSPVVADVYLPTLASGVKHTSGWTTVMVGGLKQGGRSIYALNVLGDVTTAAYTDTKRVMWEYGVPTATTDADKKEVGYTFGTPTVAQVKSGAGTVWAVIFGNGYDSASDKAQLFVVDLATGNLIRRIDTGNGSATTPNGLSEPAVVLDTNKVVKYVYAGDLRGNVWKFDLTSSSSSSWNVAYSGSPFFTTADDTGSASRQPITAGVAVGTNPVNNKDMVYVVTGKYFEATDANYTASGTGATVPHINTIYGLEDDGTTTPLGTLNRSATKLVKQTFGSVTIGTTAYRTIATNNPIDYAGTQRGWYIDLVDGTSYEGEMVINTPIVHDSRLIVTSLIPSNPSRDACVGVGGTGVLMEFKAATGASDPSQGFFDVNGDGVVDADEKKIVGIEVDGILSNPTILTNPDGKTETKIGSKASVTGSTYQFQETKDKEGSIPTGRMSWRQLR